MPDRFFPNLAVCKVILKSFNLTQLSSSLALNFLAEMDDSSYRLIFYLGKKDEIYHYSSKEHPKISKSAKFGCEML
jgi:hypothetical protein